MLDFSVVMKYFVVLLFLNYAHSIPSNKNVSLVKNIHKNFIHPVRREPTLRIVGGDEAIPHAYPYQAAIEIRKIFHSFLCGGSLITQSHVLTAAHCLDGAVVVAVILGAHNLKYSQIDGSQYHVSKDFVLHDDWNPSYLINDIAIVKLPKPATLSFRVQTINTAADNEVSYEGKESILTGWGLTSDLVNNNPATLRVLRDVVITNTECELYPKFKGVIQNTHLCLAGKYNDKVVGSCQGDSGGPLVVNKTQIGIVSFGSALCEQGMPSVFTRVSKYKDWINTHTRIKVAD